MERLHWVSACICFGVGTPLNALLLLLVATRTPEELRPYSRILAQTAVLDLAYLLVNLLHHEIYDARDGDIISFAVGLLVKDVVRVGNGTSLDLSADVHRWDTCWNHALHVVWGFLTLLSVTTISVQFYYRYRLVVHDDEMPLRRYFLLLAAGPGTVALFFTFCLGVFGCVGEGELIAARRLFPANELRTLTMYSNGADMAVYTVFVTLIDVVEVVGNYSIIVYCNIKVYRHLRGAMANLPEESVIRAAHRQINAVLVTQAMVPIVSSVLPGLCFVVFQCISLFSTAISAAVAAESFSPVMLSTLAFTWGPVLNAALALVLVKPYRKAIRLVLCFWKKGDEEEGGSRAVAAAQSTMGGKAVKCSPVQVLQKPAP